MSPHVTRFSAVAVLLAGCTTTGGGLKVYNDAPSAEITSHTDGAVLDANASLTFAGTGGDLEDVATDLVSEWQIDGSPICENVALEADGRTTCSTILSEGSYTLTLLITDTAGQTATDNISIIVEPTNAPVVTITGPDTSTGDLYYADQEITFTGLAEDIETAAGALVIEWSSDIDGALAIDDTADASGNLEGGANLSEGSHTVTLRATDEDGLIGEDSLTIDVLGDNVAPDCDIVNPTDGDSGDSGVEIDFQGTADDANVGPELLTAVWDSDVDGELHSETPTAEGTTGFATDALSVGTHRITLTVTDDRGEVCTDEILYSVGTPPEITIDSPTTGTQQNDGTEFAFTATASDAETVPADLMVDWSSDLDGPLGTTPLVGSGSNPGDPGTAEFALSSLSPGGHTITARVQDSDSLYAEDTVGIIVNDLPGAPTISIAPATPTTVDSLVAAVDVDSTDLEGHTMTYTYAWTVDGSASSVTAATVPSSDTTRGQVWEVTVTPNDGYGDGDTATASVTIDNALPTVDSAPVLTPDPAYEADTLTCTHGATSDADGDTVTSATSWYVNSTTVAATSTTLSNSFFAKGDSVYCEQTPNDGYGDGASASSNIVVISNTAPEVSNVAISPDPGYAADTLTCTWTFTDDDGDSDASTVEWQVNGSVVGTGSTLTGGFVHTDTVTCTVTPNDGTDAGTAGSDTLTVSNTAPVLSSASVTPTTAVTGDTLTCTPGSATDDDGETIGYSYNWLLNGVSAGVTSSTLSASYTAKGDNVACEVTPTDGTDSGATVTSNTVTIGNTPPVMTSVSLSPSSPGTEDTITATVNASDVDGDTITYSYDWYVSSTFVATTTTGSLSGIVYFDRGDTVEVDVTPNDGTDDGSPMSSSALTVVNTPPEAPELEFDPSDPGAGVDAIVCDIDTASYDADGDAVTYTFTWTADGAAYPSAVSGATGPTTSTYTNDTIPAADTDLALDWVCTVTPTDSYGDTGTAESALVTVLDVTDPDAPVITTPTRYRNTDTVDLAGTCDASDCDTVTVECLNASDGAFEDDATCSGGSWSTSFAGVARGVTTTCTAYCTDAAGNTSGDSNTVNTDVCSPEDTYEDGTGYGDASSDPVDEWSAIDDSGSTTYSIEGNILESDSVDWYRIQSTDDATADVSAGIDTYSFEVELLDPNTGSDSTVYEMEVYKGSDATSALECSSSGGYTHYTHYNYDRADGSHSAPADRRSCSSGSSTRNDCEDYGTYYYVKVTRLSSSITSCDGYELSVTNGQFVCSSSECPY